MNPSAKPQWRTPLAASLCPLKSSKRNRGGSTGAVHSDCVCTSPAATHTVEELADMGQRQQLPCQSDQSIVTKVRTWEGSWVYQHPILLSTRQSNRRGISSLFYTFGATSSGFTVRVILQCQEKRHCHSPLRDGSSSAARNILPFRPARTILEIFLLLVELGTEPYGAKRVDADVCDEHCSCSSRSRSSMSMNYCPRWCECMARCIQR